MPHSPAQPAYTRPGWNRWSKNTIPITDISNLKKRYPSKGLTVVERCYLRFTTQGARQTALVQTQRNERLCFRSPKHRFGRRGWFPLEPPPESLLLQTIQK